MPHIILSHSIHPLGGHFLAKTSEGTFLAGQTEKHALPFNSAQAVIDYFGPVAEDGAHWAWNICYMVEEYV